MRNRLTKILVLVLSGVLLISLPGLAACGGDDDTGEEKEILIGILTDFTGPAASAVKPTVDGFMEYIELMQERDPIPGVEIKFITRDQRTDYSRTVPGYIWLKGRGVDTICILSPTDRTGMAARFGEDKMPVFGSGLTDAFPANDFEWNVWGTNGHEVEALMQWVMDTDWDYAGEGRPPKIGHLGWILDSTDFHQTGIDYAIQANPGKFEFVGLEKAPMGTSAWTIEVNNLMESDYIVVSVVGGMMASFIKDARLMGYEGNFLSGTNAFPGYWDLARAIVQPADQLYGSYFANWSPWWDEDVQFIRDAKEIVNRWHADEAESLFKGTPGLSGPMMGLMVFDALKRAVADVGIEELDGDAINDAFAETNLVVDGFGNTWKFGDDYHALLSTLRIMEWNTEDVNWVTVSDWITPDSLGS